MLQDEIFEQPAVARHLLSKKWPEVQNLAARLSAGSIRYIFIAARGSSDNAGLYAKYLFGTHNRLPVALAAPSLFSLYHPAPHLDECLVLAISQSGQSPDILSVVSEARRQGAPTIAITNSASSPLASAAEFILDIEAGIERSVAATKTYSAELLALALLSVAMSGNFQLFEAMQNIPDWMDQVLHQEAKIDQAVKSFLTLKHCVVIGRGYNYATAFEWSLKLKELAYVITEPYSSADFMHGPVALIEEGFPVFLVAPDGNAFSQIHELVQQVLEPRKARVLSISNRAELSSLSEAYLAIPGKIPEWLTPIISILPAQLFSARLAAAKGFDAQHPRGLNKITRTR